MDTQAIAQALVDHCRNHTEAQGLKELYAEDAVSVEPMAPEGQPTHTHGVGAIQAKHDWWNEAFEVHGANVDGPYVNENKFSVIFDSFQ